MTGLIKRTTTNYNLRIPNFDVYGWGREMERNLDILDASLFAATSLGGITGVWTNNTSYDVADRVVDASDSSIWQCQVAHTSPTTGTFAAARAANPTYWESVTQTFNYRGQWTTATNYVVNDIVYLGYQWALAKTTFTSSGSLAQDIIDGNFVTLFDGTATVNAATAAKVAAETAESNAELAEANAETAEANAELAETSAETAATNAAASEVAAEAAQTAAEAAETLAEAWASNPEDVAVSGGKYSAMHYMLKAEDYSIAANLSAVAADNSADAALISETNADASEAAALASQTAAAASAIQAANIVAAASALSGFRNKIINGDFGIWQRGTSQTISGYGSDDRWANGFVGGSLTHSQQTFTLGQTDVPGNPTYFSRSVVTHAAGAGNYHTKIQSIENVRILSNKTVTVTFYAKADSSKSIGVELYQSFGTGGSPSAGVSTPCGLKALTTAWQKFSFTVSVPSISGKTLGSNNNDYTGLFFWFESGSTNAARASNVGQQSGTFDISHVSIVEGNATTESDPFAARHINQELELCERYFRLVNTGVTSTAAAASEFYGGSVQFNPPMRAAPSVTIFGAAKQNVNTLSYTRDLLTKEGYRVFTTSSAAGFTSVFTVDQCESEL